MAADHAVLQSGTIDFNEFLLLLTRNMRAIDYAEEMASAFKCFDQVNCSECAHTPTPHPTRTLFAPGPYTASRAES
jgi:hypothetical protein